MFIVISIVTSEIKRKQRQASRRIQPPRQEDYDTQDFHIPEQSVKPVQDSYYGEDVPRTTENAVSEEKKDHGQELDLDPEKMIIYSEILKPKF